MIISSLNSNFLNVNANKKTVNSRLFAQKPDIVSFTGKRPFSYTDKGILQTSIDECKNKEEIQALLKNEDGVYKYRPFTIFEILTQKDKPNFKENLKALQEFKKGNAHFAPEDISMILAACDGKDVKERLDLITSLSKKGIKVIKELFYADNEKFKEIKPLLEEINDSNKNEIIATCYTIAVDVEKPWSAMSPADRLLTSIFGKKHKKDDLEKLIESGKYKNISKNDLKKYKEEHFKNYVELFQKAKTMPQVLDMINHLTGLGQHSKYKDEYMRKMLKDDFKFEDVANICLQKASPVTTTETDIVNKLLFGKPSPELKTRINEFKKKTGINLCTDNNIPVSYIDRLEKMLPDLKQHYIDNSDIVGAYITNILEKNVGGNCHNSGIKISTLYPSFESTVYHEYAHVAHKRCIPFDGEKVDRYQAWENLSNKKFYPKDSIEYKTTVSQLRDYATTNFVEFVAVLNEKIGEGKFEVVINDKGEKVLRKYLKDGDTTTAKDLEILMNIYKSAYGPDVGAKKASDTTSQYVETPFQGTEKFNFIKNHLENAKKRYLQNKK